MADPNRPTKSKDKLEQKLEIGEKKKEDDKSIKILSGWDNPATLNVPVGSDGSSIPPKITVEAPAEPDEGLQLLSEVGVDVVKTLK